MRIIQLLKAHNKKVDAIEYRPNICKHCKSGGNCLRPRQLIRRLVRFLENRYIHRLHVFVILWSCSACNRSFRHLPPFLEPHKRFMTPSIVNRAREVLKRKRKAYRKTTINEAPGKIPIAYDKADMGLSHSSVWRWIQWMGKKMSKLLSTNPKMAKGDISDSFKFSKLQWRESKCLENLRLARQLWLAQILFE